MTTYLAFLFALVVWIVLWALGVKSFDAAMLAALIVLLGATVSGLTRYLPGNRVDRPGRRGF